MKKVLILNASARKTRSVSRELTNFFEQEWNRKYPHDAVHHREIGQANIPHVSEPWIASAFKPAELRTAEDIEVLKISDELILELKNADVIVLGTPMYNWSIPSVLKAYLDQVIRVNETILVDPLKDPLNPYTGLLGGKKVYLLVVRGIIGYGPGEPNAHINFQTEYLKTVFRMMGITDIHEIALNGSTIKEEFFLSGLSEVQSRIRQIVDKN